MTSIDSTLNNKIEDYAIIYDQEIYLVNPILFSKLSTKFIQIYQQFPGKYEIPIVNYSRDTFETFITACERRSFTATHENVLELRQIAEEWGVLSLIKYCNTYIEKNNIQDIPPIEIVSNLIKAVENSTENVIDSNIKLASMKFQQVLNDPRFSTLPTDVIYRIITLVERRPENQRSLINFVIKLFEKSPEIAVPLVLRINYDILDDEDYNSIFTNNEMHDQNINYYTARSMSSIHGSTTQQLKVIQTRFDRDIEEKREIYSQKYKELFEEISKDRKSVV